MEKITVERLTFKFCDLLTLMDELQGCAYKSEDPEEEFQGYTLEEAQNDMLIFTRTTKRE